MGYVHSSAERNYLSDTKSLENKVNQIKEFLNPVNENGNHNISLQMQSVKESERKNNKKLRFSIDCSSKRGSTSKKWKQQYSRQSSPFKSIQSSIVEHNKENSELRDQLEGAKKRERRINMVRYI